MEDELYGLMTIGQERCKMDWFLKTLDLLYNRVAAASMAEKICLIRHSFVRKLVDAGMGIGKKDTRGHYVSIRFTGPPDPKIGDLRPFEMIDGVKFMGNIEGYIRAISLTATSKFSASI
jgi:hypothetical protein